MAANVLLVAIAVALQAPKSGDPDWQSFSSKDGGFTVSMPDKPVEQKQSPQTPQGPLNVIVAFAKGGDSVYIAMKIQNPMAVTKEQEQQFLDGAQQSDIQSTKGTLVSKKDVTFNGHKGRELVVESPAPDGSGATVVSRIRYYPQGKSTYNLRVMAPKGKETPKDIDKFFDSFKIAGPDDAAKEDAAAGEDSKSSKDKGDREK